MESAASALLFLFRGSASEAEGVLVLLLIYFFMSVHPRAQREFGSDPPWVV